MGKLALGSDERKAEYDRRGWAYDDTIAGDHKGAYKAKKDNISLPPAQHVINIIKKLQRGWRIDLEKQLVYNNN